MIYGLRPFLDIAARKIAKGKTRLQCVMLKEFTSDRRVALVTFCHESEQETIRSICQWFSLRKKTGA